MYGRWSFMCKYNQKSQGEKTYCWNVFLLNKQAFQIHSYSTSFISEMRKRAR